MTNTRGSSVRCSGRATERYRMWHHEAHEPMIPQVATLAAVSKAVHA